MIHILDSLTFIALYTWGFVEAVLSKKEPLVAAIYFLAVVLLWSFRSLAEKK